MIPWQNHCSFHVEGRLSHSEVFGYLGDAHLLSGSIWKQNSPIQANHPNSVHWEWAEWFIPSWSGSGESPRGGSCSSWLRDIHQQPDGAFHGVSGIPGKWNGKWDGSLLLPSFFGGEGWWYFNSSQILIAGKFYEKPKTAVVDPTSSSPSSSLYSMKGRCSCWRIHAACPTQYLT